MLFKRYNSLIQKEKKELEEICLKYDELVKKKAKDLLKIKKLNMKNPKLVIK